MDAGTKILTLLSESIVDALTPGQIAEGTNLSISSVNVHLAKLLERKYVYFSGAVATSGRYAKQYSISPDGLALVASGHTDLIITNADNARVAEQMLEYFKSVMAEITEQFLARLETSETELNKSIEQLRGMTAETVALVKHTAQQPVANKPKRDDILGNPNTPTQNSKDESPVWSLKTYAGTDVSIQPIVDKLTDGKIKDRWVKRRLTEYGVSSVEELAEKDRPAFDKAIEIATAAKAQHEWS